MSKIKADIGDKKMSLASLASDIKVPKNETEHRKKSCFCMYVKVKKFKR